MKHAIMQKNERLTKCMHMALSYKQSVVLLELKSK